VQRIIAILIIASTLLTGCVSSSPSLWGTVPTPTPASRSDPLPAPVNSTPDPAETVTPSNPPLDDPAAASTPSGAVSFLEPTYTPTFNSTQILYYAQNGDTVPSLAKRFGVAEEEIVSNSPLPETGLIEPGTLIVIPDRISEATTPNIQIMPDNEIIFSATAVNFDVEKYVKDAGGHLSDFREFLGSSGWIDGHAAITRLASENSINPRLLLGILEYESRWVRGEPIDLLHTEYPMGYDDYHYKGMYIQLAWAINQISNGYYDWRAGTLTHLEFTDGTKLRIDPRLNAGTVAIQYLFSRVHSQSQWSQIINPQTGFPKMYEEMFGDPWARADLVNPIFPPGLTQPEMVLPFEPEVEWSYTGGPHGAWEHEGALAALDFAPSTEHGGCEATPTWVVAASPGLVVRADNGVVVIDMDGDGYEQTGWNMLYLHIGAKDRVKVGTWVEQNDRLGHASCEGGISTGTHLHFARKFNGEWIAADGPLPFVLSGWRAVNGEKPYEGKLVNGDKEVIADPVGQKWSNIYRQPDEPEPPDE